MTATAQAFPGAGSRICIRCRIAKPETSESFYFRRDSGRFREECKTCFKAARTARYWSDPDRARAIARKSYRKPEGDASKGVLTKRRNRLADPNRYRAILERYERAHGPQRRTARVERHQANRSENNAASRAWYYANQTRAMATSLAWKDRNPARARLLVEETRLRRRAVYRTLSTDEWLEICERFDGLCAYCDAEARELEHVVPLSKGGDHTAENVVPACRPCNRSKAAKWLDEWLVQQATPPATVS